MVTPLPLLRLLAALCIVAAAGPSTFAQEPAPVEIQMSVLPGLKFDVPRFAVKPGGKVKLRLRNPDQMIHNLVITKPGARMEVVMAALALGADGPAKDFVPDSPKVLWHTKALNPGETQELAFQAPEEEGVYPYVCTFTGHGMVMYGAMYVTTKAELPPLETDPNIPQAAEVITDASDHSHHQLKKPVVSRTFLPDCGPAAIAIGLPGGQSYCFDAGLCRLRYIWRGGFVDNSEHWSGKGTEMGKVVGRIYYRAPNVSPWRIGSLEQEPALRWKGYRLQNGTPQLEYTVDGKLVREWAQPQPNGILFTFEVEAGDQPVSYTLNPNGGVNFTASAGTWEQGTLRLTAAEAKHFTVLLRERPRVEPLRYWSMNDLVFSNKKDPEPGVIGNAFTPGGTDGKKKVLYAGITMEDLARRDGKYGYEATMMAWIKLKPDNRSQNERGLLQTAISIGTHGGLRVPFIEPNRWHHVAETVYGEDTTPYLDGLADQTELSQMLEEKKLPISIGSVEEKDFLNGYLDEVRIYDRVLSPVEIKAIYEREVAHLPEAERPQPKQP